MKVEQSEGISAKKLNQRIALMNEFISQIVLIYEPKERFSEAKAEINLGLIHKNYL